MKYEEQFEGKSREEILTEMKNLKTHNARLKTMIQTERKNSERAWIRMKKAMEVENNFEEQVNIQVALKTKEISENYLEFVKIIKEIMEKGDTNEKEI